LRPDQGDGAHWRYYRDLLRTRRGLSDDVIDTEVDEQRRLLRVRRDGLDLTMNFSDHEVDGLAAWSSRLTRRPGHP
jgi:hypothetical protein